MCIAYITISTYISDGWCPPNLCYLLATETCCVVLLFEKHLISRCFCQTWFHVYRPVNLLVHTHSFHRAEDKMENPEGFSP